ncbi:transposase family protein [Prevotella aurantiaca]
MYVQTKERISCCPCCGARSVVKNRYRLRDFVRLPIGGKRVTIRMKVQRYKCKE